MVQEQDGDVVEHQSCTHFPLSGPVTSNGTRITCCPTLMEARPSAAVTLFIPQLQSKLKMLQLTIDLRLLTPDVMITIDLYRRTPAI